MIDFSTLQGLSIPEGAVTQIADASGKVIWSAVKSVVGDFYLRPSADISVGHMFARNGTVVAYHDGYTNEGERPVYVFINEEVSDENSTYLLAESVFNGTRYSNFATSGALPNRIKNILSSQICVSGYTYTKGDGMYSELSVIVCVDNNEIEIPIGFTNNAEVYEFVEKASGEVSSAINTHLANNGVFPSVNVKIKTNTSSTSSIKSSSNVIVSQVFIKLTCEYVT